MKVQYTFVTGEVSEIEVTEELGTEISVIEKAAQNKERAETRRHLSLDALDYEGERFSDGTDIQADYARAQDIEALYRAMGSLSPQQRELIQKVFIDKKSVVEIARGEGINPASVSHRLERIYRKLKKMLK